MVNLSRWSVVTTLVVCLLAIVYALPNVFPKTTFEGLPGFLPHRQVSLGLDLQGGSSLLLEVEAAGAVRQHLQSVEAEVRQQLRRRGGERIGYTGLGVSDSAVVFTLLDAADREQAVDRVEAIDRDLRVAVSGDRQIRLELTEEARQRRIATVVEQSIEIVRRRVDELGTTEPSIQRQGDNRILVEVPGIDNPEHLKQILSRTAKLTIHLVDEGASVGDALSGRVPAGSMLLMEPATATRPETPYVVRREVAVAGDQLVDAQPSFQDGRPVVSFRFDAVGARRFGDITSQYVKKRLAIVLDNKIVSAPTIQSPILGGSGIITGSFTVQEVNDLALVLRAGALPADIEILEERTIGPGLGRDSIEAGKIAAIVGFALVVASMAVSYGLLGLMAGVALVFNLFLLLAALSALQATLTLPGIAGIVLTMGMAVDANVLIFERIREEIRAGRTPISAIDAGYRRAMSTIIDSNLTTLIAALLLFQFGTGPIRGFAVTLSIGIISSMYTAIMVTRVLVVWWLRRRRPQTIPI
ncbi:MAG: protein translocase subunit SecD [Alphaproteobacteria bacterium]|nr:protein translocase subunit SecD [Alphaproteobacteria bacterium]